MELLDLGRGSEGGLGSIPCSHDPWRFRVLVGAEELVGVESVILLNMKCSIEDQRRCEAGAECREDADFNLRLLFSLEKLLGI